MKLHAFLGAVLVCAVTTPDQQVTTHEARAKGPTPRPNILRITCEDISPHLGCYGGATAVTPAIDGLARQGVRYENAFATIGVCAPARSTLITGMYPNSIGTQYMRCRGVLPEGVKTYPEHLRQAGYYCTNNSKTDYQFKTPSAKQIWDESSGKAHWKNRPRDSQPFFAVFNFGGCHESGIANQSKYEAVTKDLGSEQRQDPAGLTTLPPTTPTRRSRARIGNATTS